jgi:putative Mn2+ efflux pump MntP
MSRMRPIAALGLSTCLDESAIEFRLGLLRLPVVPVSIAIAIVTPASSQLGLALRCRVSERFRERAQQAAAVALILAGGYLVAGRAFAR